MNAPKAVPLSEDKNSGDETVTRLPLPDRRRMNLRNAIIMLLGVIFSVIAGIWIYQHQTHIYSSDARIAADMITLSSEVSGRVTEVMVNAGDTLKAGDIILKIDNAQALAQREQIEARLGSVAAKKTTLNAQQIMLEAHINASRNNQLSALVAAEAAANAARSNLSLAKQDLKRAKQKISEKIISQQAFERTQASEINAQQALRKAIAEVDMAHAALAEVEAENQQVAVLASKLVELDAQAIGIKAELSQQAVDLENRILRSMQAGIVDDVFISSGEHVNKGQRLALVHNPEQVWVNTNIKETAVRHLQKGASVDITMDTYPGEVFMGTVARIGQTATSAFALIPNPNPSGNFTKVTQRIPVRINLNAGSIENFVLRPGMMVEVKIER